MKTVKVSVLGYKEDGYYWVAHALEMDVIGVGDTWTEALAELKGNVRAQVDCAAQYDDASSLIRPAPPHFFKRFKQAREAGLRALIEKPQNDLLSRFRSDALTIRRNNPAIEFVAA
ncbi:MAG: hypothetical protein ACR2PJ_07190 [Pseudomonadales bacterium]